jgi:tetratricopeptide (TPR) repeat protein
MSKPFLLAFLVSTAAIPGAQAPAPAPSPVPAASSATAATSFAIESLHTRVRFENDGTGSREMSVTVKVLDEQAVRRFGQFPLIYQSETEDLAVTAAQVHKADGSVVPTPPSSVRDVAMQVPGTATYLDVHQKIISIAALRPGDTLRVTARWTIKKPIAPGQFWFEHSFDDADTVLDEQLQIDVPAGRSVALKVGDKAPAEERGGSGSVSGDRRVYRWKTSHAGPPAEAPRLVAGDDAPGEDVRLSSFSNWSEFASWFAALTPPAPDAAVKAKAAALTAGARDEPARIAAIYKFVSTEIRYVSLSFGIGRFAAHRPAEVLANQYGDCKDKSVLLQALLAAAGIPSEAVLLNTARSIADDFASPAEFDHMLVRVPGRGASGADLWVDTTLEVAPPGMLVRHTRDRRGLVLGGGRASTARTPADPPFASLEHLTVVGAVNAIGVLAATVTYQFRGDSELALRAVARAANADQRDAVMTGLARESGLSGKFSDVTTSDPIDTSGPFQVSMKLRQYGYLDWAAERSSIETLLKSPLAYTKEADRKDLQRLPLGSPGSIRLEARITLPDGYRVQLPPPVQLEKVGLNYTSAYHADGATISVERELRIAGRDVPASAFAEYSTVAAAASADFDQKITVLGSRPPLPVVPADATADEVYKAAYSAYAAKRYEDAITLWKRTTELAPKMASAWNGVGLSYNRLKKYDDAIVALKKQIELDPTDKDVHRSLAGIYKAAGNSADAIKAYEKQVEINPLDGEAFKELGRLHFDDRPAAAVAPFERALALLPRDAWVAAELAAAYLDIGQPDKAREALRRLAERNPNAHVRAFAAWRMAEHGLDLDRAEELARSAETAFLAELRRVELDAVTAGTFASVDRLGWAWDAIGWIAFQRGKLPEADAYVRAAWLLIGNDEVAYHLAQICEKRGKLADALNYYLTAQVLTNKPSPELVAHVKKLAGGGDLPRMLESARMSAMYERTFAVAAASAGAARFLAIVDHTGRATAVRFVSGADALKPLGDRQLRAVQLPLLFPSDTPVRIPVGLEVACVAGNECRGSVAHPARVRLPERD